MTSVALGLLAWDGSRFSVVLLCLAVVTLAVFNMVSHYIFNDMHGMARQTLNDWMIDSDLLRKITADYVSALRDLSYTDPARAAIYSSKLKEDFLARYPEAVEFVKVHVDESTN